MRRVAGNRSEVIDEQQFGDLPSPPKLLQITEDAEGRSSPARISPPLVPRRLLLRRTATQPAAGQVFEGSPHRVDAAVLAVDLSQRPREDHQRAVLAQPRGLQGEVLLQDLTLEEQGEIHLQTARLARNLLFTIEMNAFQSLLGAETGLRLSFRR